MSIAERWRHVHGCGRFFNALRDTVTRPIGKTYKPGEAAAMTGASAPPAGGRIDRSRRCQFRFDGRRLWGHPGDTLASALLANGVHLVGRSFKYHRPRGILSAGAEEPNALVTIGRERGRRTPNLRATQVELYEGLDAREPEPVSVAAASTWARSPDLLSPLLGAGFYYKTFIGPGVAWKQVYEPPIRRAAGLGRAPRGARPDRYLHRYAIATCWWSAAAPPDWRLRARRGCRRRGDAVLTSRTELGGALLPETRDDRRRRPGWVAETLARAGSAQDVTAAAAHHGVRLFSRQSVGLAERLTDHLAGPASRHAARTAVAGAGEGWCIAAGAIERPLVFPRQRPAGDHAGRRGAQLSAPLRRAGGRPCRGRDDR